MFRARHLALVVALLPAALRATTYLPCTSYARVSNNGAIIVRVEPGSINSDGSVARTAHCKFFRYSDEKKMYEFWREHDLVNDTLPRDVVTPDDGSFLATFDDFYLDVVASVNTVVVYDSSGRMLKRWALKDILSTAEISKLMETPFGWHGSVGVMQGAAQQEVYICPPESPCELSLIHI